MAATLKGIKGGIQRSFDRFSTFKVTIECHEHGRMRQHAQSLAAELRKTADKVDSYVRKYYGAD